MTLEEQIKDIAKRWINPQFAEHFHVPVLVKALAIKAFQKMMVPTPIESFSQEWLDREAIYIALNHIELGTFTADLPAISY